MEGIVVEVLDDVVSAMNTHLSYYNKITYNISSSTPPQDVFDTVVAGSQTANLDCMLCISIFYNRQRYETERPDRVSDDLFLAPDYMHSVSERPRQLLGYDVCLRPSDNDWHIPLIVRTSAYSTRNKRTRGRDAQYLRNQRYREYQDRSNQYQEQSRQYGLLARLARSRFTSLCSFIIVFKDKTGMAGMADGDNRYYGCQGKFAGKIHRYNG